MTDEAKKQVLEHFKTQVHTAILLSIIKNIGEAYTFACAYSCGLIKFYNLDVETMQAIYDLARDEFKTLKAGD